MSQLLIFVTVFQVAAIAITGLRTTEACIALDVLGAIIALIVGVHRLGIAGVLRWIERTCGDAAASWEAATATYRGRRESVTVRTGLERVREEGL